eukprot:581155-Prymnesium_polylepis.1
MFNDGFEASVRVSEAAAAKRASEVALREVTEASARALAQASVVEAARVEQMRNEGARAVTALQAGRDAQIDALVAVRPQFHAKISLAFGERR